MANPVNRKEAILAGENVAPVTREEYFVKEAVSNGGGGGNPGYHVVTENVTIIPQQTVQLDGEGVPLEGVTVDSYYGAITFTIDGTTYTDVPYNTNASAWFMPNADEPDYVVYVENGEWGFWTDDSNEHTIVGSALITEANVTDDFALARGYSVSMGEQVMIPEQTFQNTYSTRDGYDASMITASEYMFNYYGTLNITFDGTTYQNVPFDEGLHGWVVESGGNVVVYISEGTARSGSVDYNSGDTNEHTISASANIKTAECTSDFRFAVESLFQSAEGEMF